MISKRRDIPSFTRDVYGKIATAILNRCNLNETIDILVDEIQNLLDGNVPIEDLTISKKLLNNYMNSNPMKLFSDRLKNEGENINPGDIVNYVVVRDATAILFGQKLRLVDRYIENEMKPSREYIDYRYYITHLQRPIDNLFKNGFEDEVDKLSHIAFKLKTSYKPIFLDEPIKIITKLLHYGIKLSKFKEIVRDVISKSYDGTPVEIIISKLAKQG